MAVPDEGAASETKHSAAAIRQPEDMEVPDEGAEGEEE